MRKVFVPSLLCLLVLQALPVFATTWTLTDDNSVLQIRDTGAPVQGAFTWSVDGVNHLYQQWWWYRIGNNAELPIEAIGTPVVLIGDNWLEHRYVYGTPNDAQAFELTVRWGLTGGSAGSGWSDIAETAKVVNIGTCPLDFHLFEYNDFNLQGTSGAEDAVHYGTPFADVIVQHDFPVRLTETASTKPSRWQIGPWPNLRDSLNDAAATNLSNLDAPGIYDVTFAFQWDYTIEPGNTRLISKDKLIENVIPEWNSLFLAAIGIVGTVGIRRRRR